MAANYNRPKPIDPIWYRQGCYLRIHCACGRRVVAPLGDFARSRRISFDTRIYELIARLRCSQCRRKPVPAPSRKGWTVSAAVRPRLAIRRVSPPFLRFAPCRTGDPPPP